MRRRRKHQGIDLPLNTGDPIYATFNGKVRISIPSSKSGGYGNLIVIRHDNGLETFYAHLSERSVQADEWVEAGQIIGYGGSTGRSTGPHLHFETRYCGQSFDPEPADRLPERQPAARNLPAQKELSGHPLQRLAGFRRRGGRGQRREASRGGAQGARRSSIPQDPLGRHAGRHRGALRYDRGAALPAQRHLAHHDAAHRPLAAGAVTACRTESGRYTKYRPDSFFTKNYLNHSSR